MLLLVVVLVSTQTSSAATVNFKASMTTGQITRDGEVVVARGFAVTCMQYLLRGIGTACLAEYSWATPASLLRLNAAELDSALAHLLPAPIGVQPALRIALTACYWLDQTTSAWSQNRAAYPGLAVQYRSLVDEIVAHATARGVVVVLELHWNDDVTEQQPGPLKTNSLSFWTSLAQRYGANPWVWYELYNEPYVGSFQAYFSGNAEIEGFADLIQIIAPQVNGLVLVAGMADWAYDSASLIRLDEELSNGVAASTEAVSDKLVWVLHPYMGPYQAGDPSKNVAGFSAHLDALMNAPRRRPVMVTEFGQYCCATSGACYQYSGVWNGRPMGYVEALLEVMAARDVSWTVWGWRPGTGGDCNQPDANTGDSLFSPVNGAGANYATLWPRFYGSLGGTPTVPSTINTKSPSTIAAPTTGNAPTGPGAGCGATWTQCGGQGWTGPTTCCAASSDECVVSSIWYAQCIPRAAATTGAPTYKPTSVTTKTPTATITTSPTTRKPTAATTTKEPTVLSTTKSPTTRPATTPTSARPTTTTTLCVAPYSQCGGTGYTGLTMCCGSSTCTRDNAWWSACVPSPSAAPGGPCAATWAQCGGQGWTGPTTCCNAGAETCMAQTNWYSQCTPRRRRRT